MASNETAGAPMGTPQAAPPSAQGTNLFAVLGLIGGILGLLTSWAAFVGLLLSGAGLAFSIIGKKKAAEGAGGGGVAMGGLITSIIALLISLTFTACAVMCAASLNKVAKDPELQRQLQQMGKPSSATDLQRELERMSGDLQKDAERLKDESEKAPANPPDSPPPEDDKPAEEEPK
jgi:hypothetical protein